MIDSLHFRQTIILTFPTNFFELTLLIMTFHQNLNGSFETKVQQKYSLEFVKLPDIRRRISVPANAYTKVYTYEICPSCIAGISTSNPIFWN